MKVPIKIKITEEGRSLERIAQGDILVFPNREELVKVIDKEKGRLYTQRKISRKLTGYILMYEKVLYDETRIPKRIITSYSIGKVYQTLGVRK